MSTPNLPAFPAFHFDLTDNEHGLTMRDYFAAKAMQAYLREFSWSPSKCAEDSYVIADAMLEARTA